jgi:hypothetical protein
LSICSGDYNTWTRKVAAVDYPNGFMSSVEWEMPYFNMGNTFDYAELAALIFPRPFMVERVVTTGWREIASWHINTQPSAGYMSNMGSGTGPKSNTSTVAIPSMARAPSRFWKNISEPVDKISR